MITPRNYKPGRLTGLSAPPVPGYVAHYDPSEITKMTISAGLATTWGDRTGSFDASGANSPRYSIPVSFFNYLPAVYTNGTANFTSSASTSDMSSSGFFVGRLDALSAYYAMISSNADGGLEFRVDQTTGQLTLNKLDVAQIATGNSTPLQVTAATPFVAGYVLTSSDCTLYLNTQSETDAHAQTLTASRTLVIGRSPTNATSVSNWVGWIGEIVMYDVSLTSTQALEVIAYLMRKWAIT